jgi:hypothetical protein
VKTLASLLLLVTTGYSAVAAESWLSLAGDWRFELDRQDAGMTERWFSRSLPDRVRLPGCLTERGIGDPVTVETKWTGGIVDKSWFTAPEFAGYREPGNVKVPFWLQPELYYAGPSWFQRDVVVPQEWEGKRIVLFLERPHWETRLWIDDRPFGANNALATPHEYDLGQLTPGNHTFTIRVDNRMIIDVGENSHSISDHTQGNWNGIVGRIELRATPRVWIEDVQVYPDWVTRTVLVRGQLARTEGEAEGATVELSVRQGSAGGEEQRVSTSAKSNGTFEATLELGNAAQAWDEFNPVLHELTVVLFPHQAERLTHRVRFGLRHVATDGTQFTINGRKLFFRGTLECAIFPRTGYPPTEVEEWRRIVRVCQSHGLNAMRFHSWCPPEAAFVAADELGFYLQVECSSWANQSTTLGDGKPVDRWIYEESDRILKYYGNHPSFVLFLQGNEPGGAGHVDYLTHWVERYKGRDSRRLISSSAGWPQLPENEFHVAPEPRVQAWGEGLKSRINAKPPETVTDYRDYIRSRRVPVISHEIGQWCVYPNFEEMRKYTGYLKPRNFEIFRERLEANGLSRFATSFLLASGQLQILCYKEDIESALRTPGMGGFQLLDLHDFPGQGTALVGVLDPFWEEKGYVTARAFSRFCNVTVPLARLPQRVFTTRDRLIAPIEVAHFGPAPLKHTIVEWILIDGRGTICERGEFPARTMPVDNGIAVGTVSVGLEGVRAPAQCRLLVKLRDTEFENDWDLWVYPVQPSEMAESDVLVTSQFDEAAKSHLVTGGNVLLTIPGNQVRNFDAAPVKLGFSSIFWNTAWTGRQAPTTLGILCEPEHPVFAQFPTEAHSNWQWWYIIHRAGALRLDLLPADTEPLVRVMDDWFTARPLALIVEGRVGLGKLIVCGFDLTRDASDPVSRQLRASLVRYLGSEECAPTTAFDPDQIRNLAVEGSGVRHDRRIDGAVTTRHDAPPGIRVDLLSQHRSPF